MKSVDRLLQLKEEIESAKNEELEAKGGLKQTMAALKKDFDLGSLEDAEERLEELNTEIKRLEGDLETRVAELETKYEW